MSFNATSLIEELSSLSQNSGFATDATAQAQALGLTKKLTTVLQKPEDAALELSFWPSFAFCARIAIDLDLFNKIASSETPKSSADLAKSSGGEELLIIRILRALSGLGFVNEVGEQQWTATPLTKAMTIPPIAAGHIHFWDRGTATMVKIPQYFKENGYKSPKDPMNGALQYAFHTNLEAFDYWHKSPAILNNFNTFMAGVRGSRPSWVEWFPVKEQILDGFNGDENSVLLTDIAGGRGHDVQDFHQKFPDHKGKLVLQELPAVIDDIKALDKSIERVEYDFFTPQTVKDARVYFFHFVFHDWSDETCLQILSNTIPAMKKGYSKILLNEFILPDQGSPLFPAGMDLNMMAMHAGQERTENQWRNLLRKAGLEVTKFWYPPGDGEGIVEAELIWDRKMSQRGCCM